MIYLNSGTNSVTVTLYEKSTQLQPYYTWLIQRKGTFEEVIFYQNDISPAPYYWNNFVITLNNGLGLTAGQIIANRGEWTYTIYEMASPYDLNLSDAIDIVETGILIITGTATPNQSYTGTNNNTLTYYKNI
jgi:hypothetical protein